jgi:hypothetical protein
MTHWLSRLHCNNCFCRFGVETVPDIVINDVEMMGASGRIFFSGEMDNLRIAQRVITETLENIEGRSK